MIVSALTPAEEYQLKFFGGESPKHIDLMKAIDKTNKKIGGNVIRFGNNAFGKRWKMRQEHLSQCYTTRISDILTIKMQ